MTSKEAINKIKNLLFGEEKFGLMTTKDGIELKVEGDVELMREVYIITEDGEIPAPEGEFEFEDGLKIKIKEGKIDKIDYAKDEEVDMGEHEEKTEMVSAELIDGTIVETDGELEVGVDLYVVTEEGRTITPDGSHETTDGKIVEVLDGKITDIKDKEEIEVKVEVEDEESFNELLELFTEGFNRLTNDFNVIKEKYEEMEVKFNKFSSEPATERQYNTQDYAAYLKEQKFSRLETLKQVKNKLNK